jgi:hypothetical protein
MAGLVKYESARFALQQAVEIDEVKDIRDKAQAMAAYARQANDTKLVEWATEIKVRAERKAGQMLADMPKLSGARGVGKKVESHDATPLSELGISKTQSSRWQKLAAVPDDQFEQAVEAAKEVAGEVTTAAMLRIEKQNRIVSPAPKPASILETENEEIEDKVESEKAKEELYDDFDPVVEIEKAHKEIDQLTLILEADDKLAAAMAEIKRLNALIDVIESQKRGFQSSENAAKQAAKMWKNKFEKLENQMKASGLVEF